MSEPDKYDIFKTKADIRKHARIRSLHNRIARLNVVMKPYDLFVCGCDMTLRNRVYLYCKEHTEFYPNINDYQPLRWKLIRISMAETLAIALKRKLIKRRTVLSYLEKKAT